MKGNGRAVVGTVLLPYYTTRLDLSSIPCDKIITRVTALVLNTFALSGKVTANQRVVSRPKDTTLL